MILLLLIRQQCFLYQTTSSIFGYAMFDTLKKMIELLNGRKLKTKPNVFNTYLKKKNVNFALCEICSFNCLCICMLLFVLLKTFAAEDLCLQNLMYLFLDSSPSWFLDFYTFFRAFFSGTVTNCFKVFGMFRLGFNHPTNLSDAKYASLTTEPLQLQS